MRQGIAIALFALAALATAPGVGAGAVGWDSGFSVSGPPHGPPAVIESDVVIDAAGNTTYAWAEVVTGDRSLLFARVYRSDGSVGPVQPITTLQGSAGTSTEPRLGVDADGNVRLAWVQMQEGGETIETRTYQVQTQLLGAEGEPLGEPVDVASYPTTETLLLEDLELAVAPSGAAAFAYAYPESEESFLQVRSLAPDGETATDIRPPEGESPAEIALAINHDERVFVAWTVEDVSPSGDTFVRGALLQPLAPAGIAELGGPYPEAEHLRATLDDDADGTAVFAALEGSEPAAVFASRLERDGNVPGAHEFVPSPPATESLSALIPQVALKADSGLLLAWPQGGSIWAASINFAGAPGVPHRISAELEAHGPPALAAEPGGSGGGIVVYPSQSGAGEPVATLMQAELNAEGEGAGAPEQIAAAGHPGDEIAAAEAAVSASGNAAAAWRQELFEFEGAAELRGALHDGIAPQVSLQLPPRAVSGQPVTMAASSVDSGQVSYAWDFGDGNGGAGAAISHAYPSPGTYTVTVTATDEAGNSAGAEAAIEVLPAATGGGGGGAAQPDPSAATVTPPQTRIIKGPPRKTRRRNVTVRFRASRPARFECALDRAGWKPCRSPLRLRKLVPGPHRLRVRAISAGSLELEPAVLRFRVLQPKRHG